MAKKKAKNENETNAAKPKKARGPRQPALPGMADERKIPAVEEAFEDWDEAKAKSKTAKNAENVKYDSVIAAMRDAKCSTYKFASRDGTTVTITLNDKTKLKVHKAKPEAFKDDGDEE